MHIDDSLYGLQKDEYQFAELVPVGQPDQILKGKHCEVKCYRLSHQEGRSTWHFSPYTVSVGNRFNPSSDEEQIAHAISKTPNTDHFIKFTSLDQVFHWIKFRDHSIELALSFWSENNTQNKYLLGKLQTGDIDKFSYDYHLAEARIYKSLWKILRTRGERIELICSKNWSYPFTSIREFYIEIIKEDLEGEFIACLKNRFIYKSSEIKQVAKLKRKQHKENISLTEQKKLYRLIDQYVPRATWLNNLLLVVERIAQEDDLIEQYFCEFGECVDTLSKLQIQRDCDPKARQHLAPSHTWEKGQYRQGVLPWNT
ncbi:MAG TPA: hypothetical protein V6C84_03770 [Coleofasciculaceae cyanobacterium]|jgi:hypothetical protein